MNRSEPSKRSLRNMPPHDFSLAEAKWGRGPEALKRVMKHLRARKQGRVSDEATAEPKGTSVRSIRFANTVWAGVDAEAQRRGISPHALLREAIAKELTPATPERAAKPAAKKRTKAA